jgi:hypothetical protein
VTLQQAHAAAMAAPGPPMYVRAQRARNLLARLGVLVTLCGCSGATKPDPAKLWERARDFCAVVKQADELQAWPADAGAP